MTVQIPLWTIVTRKDSKFYGLECGSDSSMDDCNDDPQPVVFKKIEVQIPLWTIVTHRGPLFDIAINRVQIPLWTIVTIMPYSFSSAQLGSDSSMDDCNGSGAGLPDMPTLFRFLYGRL